MSGERDSPAPHLNDALTGIPTVIPEGWKLPGRGEQDETCGEPINCYCACCNHFYQVERSCNKATCPKCWRRWAFKTGFRSGLRLWAARKIVVGRQYSRVLHIVVSFKYEGGKIDEFRRKAYRVLREHGIDGGAVVQHHCRNREDIGRVPDGHIHYHCIGIAKGHVIPGNIENNYVFKVIKDKRRDDYGGMRYAKEVISTLSYLLTHASVWCGTGQKHTLTWFGSISYNKLSNAALEEHCPDLMRYLKQKDTAPCPNCGGTDIEYIFDWELPAGEIEQFRPAYALEKFGVII